MYYEPRYVTWDYHPDYRFKYVPNIGVEFFNDKVFKPWHRFRPKVIRGMWRDVDSAMYAHMDSCSQWTWANRLTEEEAERYERSLSDMRLSLRGFDTVNLCFARDYGPADPRRRRYDSHGHMEPIVSNWPEILEAAIHFTRDIKTKD